MPCAELELLQQQAEAAAQSLEPLLNECTATQDQNSFACVQYRTAVAQVEYFQERIRDCLQQTVITPAVATGYVTFLRVHVDGGYGPDGDKLDGTVIFKLSDDDNRAFGFGPDGDPDKYRDQHDRMFELLRTAVASQSKVMVDFQPVDGRKNLEAYRIALLPETPDTDGPGTSVFESTLTFTNT